MVFGPSCALCLLFRCVAEVSSGRHAASVPSNVIEYYFDTVFVIKKMFAL